jgi:hypothetical protein
MTKSSDTPASTPPSGSRRRHERDAFSDKEAAKMLGIPVTKLYRICDFFYSDPDDAWDLIEGEFFEYEPGQARKRRFYEEGVMAIATYLAIEDRRARLLGLDAAAKVKIGGPSEGDGMAPIAIVVSAAQAKV